MMVFNKVIRQGRGEVSSLRIERQVTLGGETPPLPKPFTDFKVEKHNCAQLGLINQTPTEVRSKLNKLEGASQHVKSA